MVVHQRESRVVVHTHVEGGGPWSFCVVTCVKNEGPYLLEWIAHNRTIGVTDFLIFSNNCDDGSAEVLDRLDELGIVRHVPNPCVIMEDATPHGTCLSYAPFHAVYQRSDYIVVVDVDEFITVAVGDGTLNDLVRLNNEPDVISVSELLFGFSGNLHFEEGLVTEQFLYGSDLHPGKWRARRGVKSIMRNSDKISQLKNHRPAIYPTAAAVIRWIDGSGNPVPEDFVGSGQRGLDCRGRYDQAIVNHYTLRSGDAMLAKLDRGDAVRRERLGTNYYRKRNNCRERHFHVHNRAAVIREAMKDLLQDEVLHALHRETVGKHRKKISTMRADAKWHALASDIEVVVRTTFPKGVSPGSISGGIDVEPVPSSAALTTPDALVGEAENRSQIAPVDPERFRDQIISFYHHERHFLQTVHVAQPGTCDRQFVYMKNHGAGEAQVLAALMAAQDDYMPDATVTSIEAAVDKPPKALMLNGRRNLTTSFALSALFDPRPFRFSVVREPLERLVAAYAEQVVTGGANRAPLLRLLGRDPDAGLSLVEFLDIISQDPIAQDIGRHWRPQIKEISHPIIEYDFVACQSGGSIPLDPVFRACFRNLHRLGTVELPQTAVNEVDAVVKSLSKSQVAKVEHAYREDFELFADLQERNQV